MRARVIAAIAVTLVLAGAGGLVWLRQPAGLKVAYFGDSVAYSFVTDHQQSNAEERGDIVEVPGSPRLGCAIGRYTRFERADLPNGGEYNPLCDWSRDVDSGETHRDGYATVVARSQPDLAVMWFCGWDIAPRRLPTGVGTWDKEYRTLGDRLYDQFIVSELHNMIALVRDAGAKAVVFLTCAKPWDLKTREPRDYADGVAKLNDIFRALPEREPHVFVVETGPWIDQNPDPFAYRADGQHFEAGSGRPISDGYLDEQLLRIGAQL